jgi:hypothetical protein
MMFHNFNFADTLASSARAAWVLDDVLAPGQPLDFTRDFLPEGLTRIALLPGLTGDERRILNHIRGHEYLGMFELVEEFILPFVLDHARTRLHNDDYRIRALLQFASEEAKHMQLFRRFRAAFHSGFAVDCALIGPPEAIAAEVLRHEPLAVALVVLHLEWMSQRHYLESVRDAGEIDPLFKNLLRHHWMEEAQHAKLDTLIVEALAEGCSEAERTAAVDGYLAIGSFLDEGLRTQTRLNLAAFEQAIGRELDGEARDAFLTGQHQSARWAYLGCGMTHPQFRATLGAITPAGRDRVDAVAPAFA